MRRGSAASLRAAAYPGAEAKGWNLILAHRQDEKIPKNARLLGYLPVLTPYAVAAITFTGLVLDALGGLYLAYDLLGQEHGPLRAVTRAATYALIFGLGYGIPLGLMVGVVAALGLGGTLGLEFWRVSRLNHAPGLGQRILFSTFRAAALGVIAALVLNRTFGAVFALVAGAGLLLTYTLFLSPSDAYVAAARPVLNLRQLSASVFRGLVSVLAGAVAGLILRSESQALLFGVHLGIIVGTVSVIMSIISPIIEWWAERMPARLMGAIGVFLIVLGFLLQSVQYLRVLFRAG